jgi:hypothetical protein
VHSSRFSNFQIHGMLWLKRKLSRESHSIKWEGLGIIDFSSTLLPASSRTIKTEVSGFCCSAIDI